MKVEEINEIVGFSFCEEIIYGYSLRTNRPSMKEVRFCNGRMLDRKQFFRVCRLIKQGHIDEATAFVLDSSKYTELNSRRKSEASAVGGRAVMANPQNHICNRTYTHWNRGTVGLVKPWNTGLTKETSEGCRKISIANSGSRNPMFGRPVSEETRAKISKRAKENILSGKWTPNTFNSRTRKQLLYNGTLFRSSWEALFSQAFPEAQYEVLRIPYTTDTNHTYITDFVIGRNVYEIKPAKHVLLKNKILTIVDEWCKKNDYTFIIVNEFDLVDLIPEKNVRYDEFDNNTQKLIRGLYASVEKRRNKQAKHSI